MLVHAEHFLDDQDRGKCVPLAGRRDSRGGAVLDRNLDLAGIQPFGVGGDGRLGDGADRSSETGGQAGDGEAARVRRTESARLLR